MGSAGPLAEEAEEPQTLEQQHPERQTEQQRGRERWRRWTGRQAMSGEEQIDNTEDIREQRMEKQRGEFKETKSL